MPLLIAIQWLPLQTYDTASPDLFSLVLFHSALLLMFGLIGFFLFPGRNPKPISSSKISYILSLLFGTLFLLFLLQSCFPYPLGFNLNITFLVPFI